jgi:hypothetical protein
MKLSGVVRWARRNNLLGPPPRSLNITLLDFFLSGYGNDCVHATTVPDLTTLQDRVRDMVALVTLNKLDRIWQEIEHRLDIIDASSGPRIWVQ